MTSLDWVFAFALLASMALGMWRGLIQEFVAVAGWVTAFVLAQQFGERVGHMLPMSTSSGTLRYAAGFAAVFVVTVLASGVLGWLLRWLAQAVGMRPADRALGALFGLLRGMVLLLAVAVLALATPLQEHALWVESASAEWLLAVLRGLKALWPELWPDFLPV